jgi:predicted phage baseplate assembly protein
MADRLPQLDHRSAQDLVDWAKRELIPRYCPQWTDHNVSDPGIALIEIFAAMVETLNYRVNRIPEQVELRLLELMGITPAGPQLATVPLTFLLSKVADTELTLAAGIEAATVRRPNEAEIVFTTRMPLTLYPARLTAVQTRNASRKEKAWQKHQLRQQQLVSEITMFPYDQAQNRRPDNDDAFYLGFEHNLSSHTLMLHLECVGGAPRGLDPRRPPLSWQAHAPQDGQEWIACTLEEDTTLGFSQPGYVRLQIPAKLDHSTQEGTTAYWLRCLITGATPTSEYQVSPKLRSLRVETWGGTVIAEHATTAEGDEIGRSDGSPGQRFRLRQRPIIQPDPSRDEVLIVEYEGRKERWVEVNNFGASGPHDPHYTLDPMRGIVTLGPALVQPNGSLHCFGKIPPAGSRLRFQRYRYGGGLRGNVNAHELCVLKSARSYIARVTNTTAATGGQDAQSIADAAVRAPAVLRTRQRAVTADDFVQLACATKGVARAFCVTPGNQGAPAGPYQPPPPGKVRLAILPVIDANELEAQIVQGRELDPTRIRLSSELKAQVLQSIKPLCPLGVLFDIDSITEPALTWVRVRLEVRLPAASNTFQERDLDQHLRRSLLRFVHPYLGGPSGTGWPFGRTLRVYDLVAAVQPVLGSAIIEQVEIAQVDIAQPGQAPKVAQQLSLPSYGLICLAAVDVVVRREA